MSKKELISKVVESTGLSEAEARKAVDAVFDAISKALKEGDEVRLRGFGTFSTSKRVVGAKQNQRPGKTRQLSHSTRIKFSASKQLRELDNSSRPPKGWRLP